MKIFLFFCYRLSRRVSSIERFASAPLQQLSMPLNNSAHSNSSSSTSDAAAVGGHIAWPLTIARVFYPLLIIGGTVGNLLAVLVIQSGVGSSSRKANGTFRDNGAANASGRLSARRGVRMSSHSRKVFTLLALADTFALLVNPPRYWLQSVFTFDVRTVNDAVCVVHSFLTYFSKDVASWALVLVSFERLLATLWPYRLARYQSGALRYWLHGSVYALLLLKNASIIFKVHVLHNTARAQCDSDDRLYRRAFFWLDLVIYSCLPFVALIVCNSTILMALRRHRKSVSRRLLEHSAIATSSITIPSEATSRRQSKQASVRRQPPVPVVRDNNKRTSLQLHSTTGPTPKRAAERIASIASVHELNNRKPKEETNRCATLMPEAARFRRLVKYESTISFVQSIETLSNAAENSNAGNESANGLNGGEIVEVHPYRSLRRLSSYNAEEADEESGVRSDQTEAAVGETRRASPKRNIESVPSLIAKRTSRKCPTGGQQSLATRLLLPVSIFHLVCTLPLSILGVLDAIAEMRFAARTSAQMDRIFQFALLILMLAHLNHASNCVLYFVASQRFRCETQRVVYQLWRATFCSRAHSQRLEGSSSFREAARHPPPAPVAINAPTPTPLASAPPPEETANAAAVLLQTPTAEDRSIRDRTCSGSMPAHLMQTVNNGSKRSSDTHTAATNYALEITCAQLESSL